ncbi:MAG: peptide deformylase [Anaerolineales bacterium]|jgi:peptide deformylase|nr:peptide deformylase [Anaerolineales bacterium]NTW11868.1 peptide deformylase [Anaerolineales bacterium]
MTLRKIVTLPDPVLRRKARAITKFDKDLGPLIDDMVETMREAPGVGLAAPQIGLPERLIVIEYYEREEDEENEEAPKKVWAMINPEIVKSSEEMLMGVEGCLSIPGLLGEVERHAEVQVKGLNRHGKPMKIKAKGWLARIFQHEIDHLNGVLFPDRATRVWQPKQEVEQDQEF